MNPMDDKKTSGTETSAFGTPGHVSHDSSRFYQSRMYAQLDQGKKVKYFENPSLRICLTGSTANPANR